MCKSADLLLMVLDAGKPHFHREILTRELESVGIRLNRDPPRIYLKRKKTGGIAINSMVPLQRIDEKMVIRILQASAAGGACAACAERSAACARPGRTHVAPRSASPPHGHSSHTPSTPPSNLPPPPLQEYKLHNCDVLFKEDCTVDDLIDVIEGNRRYCKCLYVYNKIDVCSMEEVRTRAGGRVAMWQDWGSRRPPLLRPTPHVTPRTPRARSQVDEIARRPYSIPISCYHELNLDGLLARIWDMMVRCGRCWRVPCAQLPPKCPASHQSPPRPPPHTLTHSLTQGLVRIYAKKVGERPDFTEPVVLSEDRGGTTLEHFCSMIHRTMTKEFKYALVWGTSSKHMPQR